LRIDAPFFHMDLDLGGRGPVIRDAPPAETRPKEGEAVPAPRADEMPAPAPRDGQNGQNWRYRFHDGRWWYWLPSGRWAYWQDGRWIDYDAANGRRAGLPRNGGGGINLQDLMRSDRIRIGEPRRGIVELELEGLPPLNIGF
jgi:hypothetical protein